jgi:uncharacterized protein
MKQLVTMVVCLFLAQAVFSQTEPTAQKVKELIRLTGMADLGLQVKTNMIREYRTMLPHVDSTFWNDFLEEVKVDEMVELVVPVYQKRFTSQDVDGLIKFYQSPIGKKMVAQLPEIMQECYQAGQQYGEQLGKRVAERLRSKGIEPEKKK